MTNERAIELLHRLQDEQFDGIHGDERREALEMAVRALFSQQIVNDSQGLVNDCISRKMAIDEVKRLHDVAWANWKETRISANTMIDALKDLPSAQPERPEQPESAKEYCAECNHIEMCRWYPYEGCEFRSLPSAQPENIDCGSGELVQEPDGLVKDLVKDCISRQQAIEVIDAVFPVDPMKSEYAQGIACGAALAKTYVEQLQSAQPQRKKGKWITVEGRLGNEVECNQCHSVFWYWMGNYRFCPSCGADMRGESE